tara:strand:+ start:360 stop:638 length:279 start_codon:yes stop_codon:yes gene_type:complete
MSSLDLTVVFPCLIEGKHLADAIAEHQVLFDAMLDINAHFVRLFPRISAACCQVGGVGPHRQPGKTGARRPCEVAAPTQALRYFAPLRIESC